MILTSCEKEEKATERVALRYVDVIPDTTFININSNDTIKFISEEWIEYNGPHPYTYSRIKITSNNPNKISLSYGKFNEYSLNPLVKNSLVDKSLEWYETYIVGGFILTPIGYKSEYIGIKITENNNTYYGWIHTPTYLKITEYAIDTNSTIQRPIKAGVLEK